MNKQSLVLLLFFIAMNGGSVLAQQIDTTRVRTEQGELEGSLYTPEQTDSFPLVLIIAGSGPTNRNGNQINTVNNAYRMLADSLVKYGIGSLRYDKRGLGPDVKALMPEDKLRFETFVNDAVAWIELLDSMPEVSEIIVCGHSAGSLIGILAAQKTETDKLISLAGAGSPIQEILREQLKAQAPNFSEMALRYLDSLEQKRKIDSVPLTLYALFRPSLHPYLLSWFKYDPVEELQKLNIPALVIHGTTDIQGGITEAKKLAKGYPKSELVIIEGMNHVLKPAPADRQENIKTYNDPDLPLHEDLIPPIITFIKDGSSH